MLPCPASSACPIARLDLRAPPFVFPKAVGRAVQRPLPRLRGLALRARFDLLKEPGACAPPASRNRRARRLVVWA
jgi:hypothetical protein